MMENRLINANDQVLWRLSVVMPDGNRYVPWEAIAEVPTAIDLNELRRIVNQLESCEYMCEGGPLEMNNAFFRLKEMACSRNQEGGTADAEK